MMRRYVSLWFPYLVTDWFTRRYPELANVPFVITAQERGRLAVTMANPVAEAAGILPGMALADARTLISDVETFDDKPGFSAKLVCVLADWAIRYTPVVQTDSDNGLMLDATGCAHLRGGEHPYLKDIVVRLRTAGYQVRGAMADTVGGAWAVARFGKDQPLIPVGETQAALSDLPPAALRISEASVERLRALGIRRISELMVIPRASLGRRFGQEMLLRLSQALDEIPEALVPNRAAPPLEERLVSADGTATAEGIAKALRHLLDQLCARLEREGKGVRALRLDGHRLDGQIETVAIGTSRPNRKPAHLFKLFENKLDKIEPALGIEVFVLTASQGEPLTAEQEEILERDAADADAFPQLLDRISNRMGFNSLARFLPLEQYWPERSFVKAKSFDETPSAQWQFAQLRPIKLISPPEPIEVTAPVPDYPPLFFRHRGKHHRVKRADGPERIERAWWIESGEPRDYFRVEDDEGVRFWIFRSGPYRQAVPALWFLHGIFA